MVLKPPFKLFDPPLKERAENLLHHLSHGLNHENDEENKKDLHTLVHELQVHQIELELQNEELLQTQLKLSETRDAYRQLYEYAPIAYLTLDGAGTVLEANLKAAELLGEPRASLIGKRLSDYIGPSCQDDWYLYRNAVFAAETKQVAELTLKSNSPPTRVRIESLAMTDQTTGERQGHTILIDITQQKLAEESLRKVNRDLEEQVKDRTSQIAESLNQLSAILSTATDAIITVNDNGIIECINPATEAMFGFSKNELIGQRILLIIPVLHTGAQGFRPNNYFEEFSNLGKARDLLARRRDGTLFPVNLSVNRIDQANRFTSIIRETTERVEFEKELLQRTEEERNRISRELHDTIGQGIVGIAMKTRSLSRRIEREGGSPLSGSLEEISTGLETLSGEIRTIINDFAPLNLEENELNDIFQWLVDSRGYYSDATITLNWPDQVVITDSRIAVQLFRIAQEALNNAIKHAQATAISVEIRQTSGLIRLSVIDNGKGTDSGKSASRPAFGLSGKGFDNMKYRAHAIGAKLEIASNLQGTRVDCTLFY